MSNERFVVMLCDEIASLQYKNDVKHFFCELPPALSRLTQEATAKMNSGNARASMYNSVMVFDLGIWYGKYGDLNIENFQRDCNLENFIRMSHFICGIIFLQNWMITEMDVNEVGKWRPKKTSVNAFLTQLKENNDTFQQVFVNQQNREAQHRMLLSVVADAVKHHNQMKMANGDSPLKCDVVQWLRHIWIPKIDEYYLMIQENQNVSRTLFHDTFYETDLSPLKITIFVLREFWAACIKDFLNFTVYQLNHFLNTHNPNVFSKECELSLKNPSNFKDKRIMKIARRCVNALFLLCSSTFWTTLSPFWFTGRYPDSVESKYWFRVMGIFKVGVGDLIEEIIYIDNDNGLFVRKLTNIMLKLGKLQLQLDEFDLFVDSKNNATESLLKFYRRQYDYVVGATRDQHKKRKLLQITKYESDFVINDLDVPYEYDDDLFVPQ